MTSYDYAVLAFYFIFMLVISWVFRRFVTNVSDYFRGGGKALWWMVGGSGLHGAVQRVDLHRGREQGLQRRLAHRRHLYRQRHRLPLQRALFRTEIPADAGRHLCRGDPQSFRAGQRAVFYLDPTAHRHHPGRHLAERPRRVFLRGVRRGPHPDHRRHRRGGPRHVAPERKLGGPGRRFHPDANSDAGLHRGHCARTAQGRWRREFLRPAAGAPPRFLASVHRAVSRSVGGGDAAEAIPEHEQRLRRVALSLCEGQQARALGRFSRGRAVCGRHRDLVRAPDGRRHPAPLAGRTLSQHEKSRGGVVHRHLARRAARGHAGAARQRNLRVHHRHDGLRAEPQRRHLHQEFLPAGAAAPRHRPAAAAGQQAHDHRVRRPGDLHGVAAEPAAGPLALQHHGAVQRARDDALLGADAAGHARVRHAALVGWTTVAVGFCSSLFATYLLTPAAAAQFFHVATPLSRAATEYWEQGIATVLNLAVGSAWFLGTKFFWDRASADYKERVLTFFANLHRPIEFTREEGAGNDARQSRYIGWLCLAYGGFVTLLAIIPNPLISRLAFIFCGGLVVVIGGGLVVVIGGILLASSRRAVVPS